MFTGIIEAQAEISKIADNGIFVELPKNFDDIKIGSSISVSGACLSVVSFDENTMEFDVIPETWNKTKLGSLRVGDKVNLERAMKASDRFEGHIVQGHVEGVGEVISLSPQCPFSSPPSPLSTVSSLSPQPPSPEGRGGLIGGKDWKEFCKRKKIAKIILERAKLMRRKPTSSEAILWGALRRKQVGDATFRRQHPVGMFILDFYCHEARLGIEIDGGIHKKKDQIKNDREREQVMIANRDIRIIRFTNDEVLNDLENVIRRIEKEIKNSPLPSGEGPGEREEFDKLSSRLVISVSDDLLRFIVNKGSITIDGVSLTVASVSGNEITVALIPHTLENTTLGSLNKGDKVNIETDVLVRHAKQLHTSAI